MLFCDIQFRKNINILEKIKVKVVAKTVKRICVIIQSDTINLSIKITFNLHFTHKIILISSFLKPFINLGPVQYTSQ